METNERDIIIPEGSNCAASLCKSESSHGDQGDEPLFVTKGTEPDANGFLPTFFSNGAYSAIEYVVLPTFITEATNGPFHSMYQEFHTNSFTDGMLAIEVRIDISVRGVIDSDTFSLGLWDPSIE